MIRPHPGSLKPDAPELIRLRAALNFNRDHYNAWLDNNLDVVGTLVSSADDEYDIPPIVRAEYVWRHWNSR